MPVLEPGVLNGGAVPVLIVYSNLITVPPKNLCNCPTIGPGSTFGYPSILVAMVCQ